MKRFLMVLMAGFCLFPLVTKSAPSAQARMYCLSLQFHQGAGPFNIATLDLSSSDPTYQPNGEVAPLWGYNYSQWTYFSLDDGSGFEPMVGTINLNVAPYSDVNNNGYPDFYEVSQAVSATSTGVYSIPGVINRGSLQLHWSRAAGSKTGTCVITFDNGLGDFTHTFELLEYSGPLSYSPGASTVTGNVNLTQTGNSANKLTGPLSFIKYSTNRFNLLELQPGNWTNSNTQPLSFAADDFERDLDHPTNYWGYVSFDDGNLSTAASDYRYWILSIDDTNDSNHNGIPDFSDDVTAARQPKLALTRRFNGVQLSISGDVGRVHDLQSISAVGLSNWQTVQSFTLTNDPQIVNLTLPSASSGFWRVKAE